MTIRKQKDNPKPVKMEPQLITRADYYFNEKGMIVFTAQYHLKRGYCCGNRCKHCPFGWENVAEKNKEPGKAGG